ncbi:hypothetical protein N9F47_01265 [Gammaproteobacteria bacterium]|nr:hypothetical protein [Gammaproteobacteria bacterium]
MSGSNGAMPECSVLRRHWQSTQDMKSTTSSSASSASSTSSGGIFGWLKSLFS